MRRILSFAAATMVLASVCVLTMSAKAQNWKGTGGPLGGAVGDISADSTGRVWISVLRDGVWYSEDHAETWTPISKGLPTPNIKYICASKTGYVFAVTIKQDMLYRLNSNLPKDQWIWEDASPVKGAQNSISNLATSPEGWIVLASGLNGAVRSTDNGTTWDLTFGKNIGDANLVATGRPGEYAIYHRGTTLDNPRSMWVTIDHGANWTKLPFKVPEDTIPFFISQMQIAHKGTATTISLSTQKDQTGNQIAGRIYTLDPLASTGWVLAYQQPFNPDAGTHGNDISALVKVEVSSGDILYSNTYGPTLRSTDLGMTWQLMDNEKRGDEPFRMTAEVNATGDVYLYQMSEPDGIHRSVDHGLTWVEELNKDLLLHFMFGGAIDSVSAAAKTNTAGDNAYLYGVIEFGLVSSSDKGATWQGPVEFAHESYTNSLWVESTKGNVLAGTDLGIFLSTDRGETVTQVKQSLGIRQFAEVKDLTFVGPNRLFAVMADSFYVSTDAGVNWKQAERTGMNDQIRIGSIAASVDTVILGTDNGSYYRSLNAGRTWNDIGHEGDPGAARKLIIHTDGSYLAMHQGVDAGVWRSTNGGVNWLKIFPFEGMTPVSNDCYGMNNFEDGTVIVCSDSGMYQSDPTDPTYQKWINVGSGLYFHGGIDNTKQVNASEVLRNNKSDKYYAAMRGTSFWEAQWPLLSAVRLPWASASKNSTVTSYPNPFVSGTTLGFELTEGSQVHIAIVDMMGRIAATIPTAYFGTGKHSIGFEAGNLPAGQYMVVLRAGAKTETGWITLTK